MDKKEIEHLMDVAISEINYALKSDKPKEIKEVFLDNAIRFIGEAKEKITHNKMYFYKISEGDYEEEYADNILYHEKEFSKEVFMGMVESAGDVQNESCFSVSKYLCSIYGFKEVKIHQSTHKTWSVKTGDKYV